MKDAELSFVNTGKARTNVVLAHQREGWWWFLLFFLRAGQAGKFGRILGLPQAHKRKSWERVGPLQGRKTQEKARCSKNAQKNGLVVFSVYFTSGAAFEFSWGQFFRK